MLCSLLFLLGALAHAHNVDVADVRASTEELRSTLSRLDAQFQTGDQLLTDARQLEGFEEATAAFLLGRYDDAALGFHVLRSVMPPGELRAEVDWYLAQALLEAGHVQVAEAVLREVTGLQTTQEPHPFRHEAAALLLELSASHRPAADFAQLHDELDALDLVPTSAPLEYSVARSWYLVGDHERAREGLSAIDPKHSVAPRAAYLLATLDLLAGRTEEAASRFEAVAQSPRSSRRARHVADLGRMAVARIAYEAGRYDAAAEHYSRIDGTSEVLNDALYELAWTHIARGDDEAALRAVDLFLLAFPDAARSGRMTVARGHLQMRRGDWNEATWTYEGIDARFEGIEGQLARLQATDLVAMLDGADPDHVDLPDWVQQRLVTHPELRRSVKAHAELIQTRRDLADADVLAAELEVQLATRDVALKRHRRLRSGVFASLLDIGQAGIDIVRLQVDALRHSGRHGRARGRSLQPRLEAAEQRLAVLRQREGIRRGESVARVQVSTFAASVFELVEASRLDPAEHGQHHDLDELAASLASVRDTAMDQLDDLDTEARGAVEPLSRQLARQQDDLATLHLAQVQVLGRSGATRQAAVAAGVTEVAAILDDGIREARAGMGDAAFAELQELGDAREALIVERDRLLERLELLFRAARTRL